MPEQSDIDGLIQGLTDFQKEVKVEEMLEAALSGPLPTEERLQQIEQALETFKELGLLDPNMISKNKIRYDKTENETNTTGMLIHLLANQPLKDKRGPVVFTFGSDSKNIAYDRIHKYFCDNYLETSDSGFPSTNTVKNNLRAAYSLFKTTVRCK